MEQLKKDMFYYMRDKDRVVKCKVSFSKETMEEYKKQLIHECSIIYHKETASSSVPEGGYIFNVIQHECLGGMVPLQWRWTYEEYEVPELVSWIDRLLSFDEAVLPLLLSDDHPTSEENSKVLALKEQAAKMSDECDAMANADPKKMEKLKELQALLRIIKRNEGKKDPWSLFYIIRQSLSIVESEVISVGELKKLIEFTGKTPEELGIYGLNLNDVAIAPVEENMQL